MKHSLLQTESAGVNSGECALIRKSHTNSCCPGHAGLVYFSPANRTMLNKLITNNLVQAICVV